MIRLLCCGMLYLLYCSNCTAQTEYLVHINPADGEMKKIKSIPDVRWIRSLNYTYNTDKQQYIFVGSFYPDKEMTIYALDALTGNIITKALLQTKGADNPANFVYDPLSKNVYGIYWDEALRKEYFVKVNTEKGSFEKLALFPDVHWIKPSTGCLNTQNNSYTFLGMDSFMVQRYHTVHLDDFSVHQSDVVYDTADGVIDELYYDKVAYRHIAIASADTVHKMLEIDVNSGKATAIGNLPGHARKYGLNTTYNNGVYYAAMGDGGKHRILYSIKSSDASVISAGSLHRGNEKDNLICYKYDNKLGRIVALFWEDSSDLAPRNIRVFPNPWQDVLTIDLIKEFQTVNVVLYDGAGRVVRNKQYFNTSLINMQQGNLAAGVYHLALFEKNSLIWRYKLLVD